MKNKLKSIGVGFVIVAPILWLGPIILEMIGTQYGLFYGAHWASLILAIPALCLLIFGVILIVFSSVRDVSDDQKSLSWGWASLGFLIGPGLLFSGFFGYSWFMGNVVYSVPSCEIKTDKTVYYPGDKVEVSWTTKKSKITSLDVPYILLSPEEQASYGEDVRVDAEGSRVYTLPNTFGMVTDLALKEKEPGVFVLVENGTPTFDPTITKEESIMMTVMRDTREGHCGIRITFKAQRP